VQHDAGGEAMTYHQRDTAWDYWKAGLDTHAIAKVMKLQESEVEDAIFIFVSQRKKKAA
jgi:hypothetical protein